MMKNVQPVLVLARSNHVQVQSFETSGRICVVCCVLCGVIGVALLVGLKLVLLVYDVCVMSSSIVCLLFEWRANSLSTFFQKMMTDDETPVFSSFQFNKLETITLK
jgi:hypothetical protein